MPNRHNEEVGVLFRRELSDLPGAISFDDLGRKLCWPFLLPSRFHAGVGAVLVKNLASQVAVQVAFNGPVAPQ